ncbi:zinc-dependent metalloprotease [Longispora albida]|uniref:zinc-dependent metalloprotease n=1 Tax=Longispora albida TaxID=203523 RepID=UPI00037DDDE1|nr:zinc-dependent metalloprotease [Longispora albida]
MSDNPPFGFGLPGGGLPDPNDPQMRMIMAQLQQMFAAQSGGGPVNWDLARQLAVQELGEDPQPTQAERDAVASALQLADHWLDPESSLPSGAQQAVAWTRNEWVYNTLDVWRPLCEPLAARMVSALGDLVPEELRAQLGPMTAMIGSLGGAMFGQQLGSALAKLASEVLSAGDIGLPLGPAGVAALLPANLAAYGEGLETDAEELRLYVALREAAHQRLFGHVPWLRAHVLGAVESYASGITIDREAVEEAVGRIDPSNPESMQELSLEGMFATPEDNPQQQAALRRLETILALVEGWVCHVVDRACASRLPDSGRLGEAFRRRRAAGGPAEQTFSTLVGLQLRPRRLREATALWTALAEARGVEGRDAIWEHPDLLPTDDDFADPEVFASRTLGDFTDISDLFSEPADGEQEKKEGDE